jgi:hypothetical protein
MITHEKYWYKTTFEHCPACGRCSTYKERIHGLPKPLTHEERHVTVETYDYCIEYGKM